MSLRALPQPDPSYEDLERENALLKEQLTVMEASRWFDRFHCLDGLRDDSCPCCGGRVVAEHYDQVQIVDGGGSGWLAEHARRFPQGIRLRAVPWS